MGVFVAMGASITYAQSLSGNRWRLYSPWAKLVPYGVLDRLGNRLPVRPIWQGGIVCGDTEASLSVVGGHPDAKWMPVYPLNGTQAGGWYVPSATLETIRRRQDVIRGQLMAVTLIAEALPRIARELKVYPHQLSVGLAVGDVLASYWIAGLEYVVRNITLLRTSRQRNMPLGYSGLAVRQLQSGSGALDVDVLVVAPGCLTWVTGLALRRKTAVVITDGLPCGEFVDCSLLTFQLVAPAELPPDLVAQPGDLLPLNETIVLAAYLEKTRSPWSVRAPQQLHISRRALQWSEWGWRWELIGVDDYGMTVTRATADNKGLSHRKHI